MIDRVFFRSMCGTGTAASVINRPPDFGEKRGISVKKDNVREIAHIFEEAA